MNLSILAILGLTFQGHGALAKSHGTTLSPSEATASIARLLNKSQLNRAIADPVRREIEAVVAEASFPPLSTFPKFAESLLQIQSRDFSSGRKDEDLIAALSIVCTAWDHKLHRRQLTIGVQGILCIDPDAALIKGVRGTESQLPFGEFYVSENWPWTTVRGKLVLRPLAYAEVFGNGNGDVKDFALAWRDFERK